MKTMNIRNLIPLFIFIASVEVQAEVDTLGRLFTTPAQRTMLQDLRNSRPGSQDHLVTQYEEVTIKQAGSQAAGSEDELALFEEELEDVPTLENPISLKGVVSRKKGNHTVWINENNTYEGGMMPENISVNNREIKRDSVEVKLPDRVSNITLRVGETYIPENMSEEEETN